MLLTKVTLSAIPVHISIACCLSTWAIEQIDRRRRAFLWCGTDTALGGKCKLAWTTVCRPTSLGGLGVLDLRFFGLALRLRWEWLSRVEPDRCWATLSARAEKNVVAMTDASMTVIIGDGASAKLWMDNWSNVGSLCSFAPQLFAAISPRGKKMSLNDGLFQNRWAREIHGADTVQVLLQYLRVWAILRAVVLDPHVPDRLTWKWSPDGKYSVSSTYRAFFEGSTALLGAKELGKTKAPPKVKFFMWLVLHRRIWTANRRLRHGLQDSDDCNLCSQASETCDHLFVGCVTTRQLWYRLLLPLGLQDLTPLTEESLGIWWLRQREWLSADSRPPFDTLLLLITWTIWKERNNRVFNRITSNLAAIAQEVIREAQCWCEAGYSSLAHLISLWSQNQVVL